MRTASAKQKGRRFQQLVSSFFQSYGIKLQDDDVRSASMGAPGEDILFSPAARKQFPFSVECKNVEKLSIWSAIEQARENCKDGYTPVVAFTKNREVPHIALPMKTFMEIYQEYLQLKELAGTLAILEKAENNAKENS